MLKAINLKSEILKRNIPSWHVSMINDDDRNNFYLSALKTVINTNSNVFEIGTGSALLSIMAANLGAKEINTCETNSIMANTATKIIADNNLSKKINVIQKKSNDIIVGKDINKPADVLVSEIFSSNLLSEDVLPSLEDAKKRLILKDAKIIPEYGSIMISLFGGDDIGKNIYTEKFENIKLKKFNSIIAKKHILHRQDLKIDLMSNAFEAFRFDFVNKDNFPPENKKIEIAAIKKGRSYGIIQWIKLEMGNGLKHENHPTNLTKASGWQKVLYVFDDPIELSIGQKVVITAKHERNIVWFFLEKI
jgi:type II protein arginine methyltransferase